MNDGYDDNTPVQHMQDRYENILRDNGIKVKTVIPVEWKCPQELRKVLLDPVWSWTSGA